MKKEFFSHIRNPMTIIALFVGLTEIGFGIGIRNVPQELQSFFIWFIILFPFLCALGFFIILYFRPQNFYSPLDFRSDATYLAVQKQSADLTGITQYIADEKDAKSGKETSDTLSSISVSNISSMSKETIFYLLKVANKPLTMAEHVEIMNKELPMDLLNSVNLQVNQVFSDEPSLSKLGPAIGNLAEQMFITGAVVGLWTNFDASIIEPNITPEGKVALSISSEVLKQLGAKISETI